MSTGQDGHRSLLKRTVLAPVRAPFKSVVGPTARSPIRVKLHKILPVGPKPMLHAPKIRSSNVQVFPLRTRTACKRARVRSVYTANGIRFSPQSWCVFPVIYIQGIDYGLISTPQWWMKLLIVITFLFCFFQCHHACIPISACCNENTLMANQ